MLNLCVHAGGEVVTRDQLEKVQTPAPTETHFPIPHDRFVDTVENVISRAGLQVTDEAFALSHKGMRLFGILQIGGGAQNPDYSTIIGLRGAHDKSMSRSLAFGNQVFVCDNLAFVGEQVISRKHTRYAEEDLPNLITAAVGRLGEMRDLQDRRISTYKESELSESQVNDTLIASLDAKVISSSAIRKVLEEYREPRHPEFAKDGHTAWRLFNAYTEVLKDSNLFERPKRTEALYGLMDLTVGLN